MILYLRWSATSEMFSHAHAGLTQNLLQKQQTEYETTIEKIFSEVSALEENTKILDPQVESLA